MLALNPSPKTMVTIKLTPRIYSRVKTVADARGSTVSSFIEMLLLGSLPQIEDRTFGTTTSQQET